jgi:hypothetical protein
VRSGADLLKLDAAPQNAGLLDPGNQKVSGADLEPIACTHNVDRGFRVSKHRRQSSLDPAWRYRLRSVLIRPRRVAGVSVALVVDMDAEHQQADRLRGKRQGGAVGGYQSQHESSFGSGVAGFDGAGPPSASPRSAATVWGDAVTGKDAGGDTTRT